MIGADEGVVDQAVEVQFFSILLHSTSLIRRENAMFIATALSSLNWGQVWLAPIVGVVLAALFLGRHNIYEALVEVVRLCATFLVEWVVEPLRRFFWRFWSIFEVWVMDRCLYRPLVSIKLLAGVEFSTFCYVVYGFVALIGIWLLVQRLPPKEVIFGWFFVDGRMRRSWVVVLLLATTIFTGAVAGTLGVRGQDRAAMLVSLFAILAGISLGIALLYYPDTRDFEDWALPEPVWELSKEHSVVTDESISARMRAGRHGRE